MIQAYLKKVTEIWKRGDAREESYYTVLEKLLEDFSQETQRKTSITILPKKTDAGNPDFRIWDGKINIRVH